MCGRLSYERPRAGACAADPVFRGARERNRTADLRITSALLCRLSYSGLCVVNWRFVLLADVEGGKVA